ncbi:hypothetical protein [Kineosporia babensis]|uniref:Excalibur calcium-binding domain-containing protein n=1 Tax=Kineosporia babensis TaxID=499548 RepID=A0A9X1N917_9ACTN|nr:hypothetical protein [Kineosporia babensis]MCD5309803.1 hypothetical protein [Kineosporia babensis]
MDDKPPAHEFGAVRWAGEGDTPDAGLHLSRPEPSESWVGVNSLPAGVLPAGGRHGEPLIAPPNTPPAPLAPADVSDWLDRLYGPTASPEVAEHDLGSLSRPPRRAGIPAHAANDPGRFRDLIEADLPATDTGAIPSTPERRNWPRKRIVLPMVVLLGVAGFGVGRSALQAVDPSNAQVTLADPPLLVGQKGPSGTLVTAAPKPKAPPTSSASKTPAGKHKAETPSPEATKAELKAQAESTAKPTEPKAGAERPRTTITTSTLASPNPVWSKASKESSSSSSARDSKSSKSTKDDGEYDRRGRHRKPDPRPNRNTPWQCDPNYAGSCVPIASDVDCLSSGGDGPAYLAVPARVVGRDIYNLDSDGDGWACESWQNR